MLYFSLAFNVALVVTLVAVCRPRANFIVANIALRQQLAILKAKHPRPRLANQHRLLPDSPPTMVARLAKRPRGRYARNGSPLASRWLSLILAVPFEVEWATFDRTTDPTSHPAHARRERYVGRAPHPR